ncbi:MAG: AI-2E family transporter [Rubrivivax sp.]|nr:AI-2E family transporter [Rubrivivax sp.]
MPTHPEHEPTPLEKRALLLLLAAVSALMAWILLPFYGAIMWGSILALVFAPLFRLLLPRLKHRRTPAALLTLLIALLLVVLPAVLIGVALAREAGNVFAQLQSGEMDPALHFRGLFEALPAGVTSWLDRFGLVDFSTLQQRLTEALTQVSRFIASRALGIGQVTFEFVLRVFVTLYLAFFLIRDGDGLARTLRRAIPLAPAHQKELLGKFAVVIRAVVKGNLLVAALQGLLGGLAFWFLGVQGALLWAVLMAFLSLLPAVGAGLVWVPMALYFLFTGALWQGLALTAWGVLVIGLVDNLLRPLLVGKDIRLPDYVVLISTLGGVAVLGINGFVLGPAIAAMFVAVWHIHGAAPSDTRG